MVDPSQMSTKLLPGIASEFSGQELLGKIHDIADDAFEHPWQLLRTLEHELGRQSSSSDASAQIADTAVLDEHSGAIVIAAGAIIGHHTVIKGPCYIGKNVQVREFCLIEASSLEENVIVRPYSEIKRSLLMADTHVHACLIDDSVIGSGCRFAAHTTTANRRLDRKEISLTVQGEKVPTGRTSLGIICGHRVSTGIGVTFMPGVLVGSDASIFPGQTVYTAVAPGSRVRTKL